MERKLDVGKETEENWLHGVYRREHEGSLGKQSWAAEVEVEVKGEEKGENSDRLCSKKKMPDRRSKRWKDKNVDAGKWKYAVKSIGPLGATSYSIEHFEHWAQH